MNIVRNTITEGTETYRERSRIGSINHRIWSVIAPMLFVAFGLFGVNVNAWGGTVSASGGGDCPNGNIVLTDDTLSVTFDPSSGSFSGKDAILGKYDLDYYWIKFGKNTTNNVSLTWSCLNKGYSLKVTNIDFDINLESKSEVSFANQTFNTSGLKNYKKSNSDGFTSGMTLSLKNTESGGWGSKNHEFQISNISFTYITTPHTYTINYAFNGAGTQTGSVADQSAIYDQDVTLRNNGFKNSKYIVAYNADGGTCAKAADSINYVFAGWSKSSSGVVAYAGGEKVTKANFTSTQNGKYALYAKWNAPASETITLPNATKEGYVLEGWYDGSTKVGEAGNNYTVTKNVTLKAHWTQRFDFTMSGANSTLSVDEQQNTAFSFVHASNPTPHIEVTSIDPINNGNGKVIEYDAVNNKIIAHNAGTATIYFTQAETSTIKSGTSATYTYTVEKYNNTLAVTSSSYTKYVDEEITGIITGKNSNAEVETSSTDATTAYYDVADNKIVIDNNGNNVFTSKTVTIKIWQAQNVKYTASGEKTITLTVNKYAPTFSVNKTALELEQTATLTTTNTTADLNVTIEPATGVLNYANGTFTAAGLGDATVTVTQPEVRTTSYKQEVYNFHVSKKTPTLVVKMNGTAATSKSVTRGTVVDVTFEENSDADVVVSNVSGAQYASFIDSKLTAGATGTAVYRASLAETNTYQAKTVDFSLTVTSAASNHVPFTINTQARYNALNVEGKSSGDHEWSNSNGVGIGETDSWTVGNWDDKYVTFKFEGVPDKLTFDYIFVYRDNIANKMTATPPFGSTVDGQLYFIYVEESADGSTWSALMNDQSIDKDNWKSFAKSLKKTTRYIRFHLHADYGAWFRNIKVSELKYVEEPDPETVDFGSAVINSGEVSKTSLINWCNIAPMTVTSSNPRFTVTPVSFGNFETYATQTLTVKYTHTNEAGTNEGDITISNGDATYTKTIHVTAETTKRPQTITWNSDLVATGYAMNVSEQYPDEVITTIATATNGGNIKYTSDNTNVIEVIDGVSLSAVGTGKANITAYQAGDDDFDEVSDTKEFTVTELQKQVITWNQNLYGLLTTSGNVTLNATATSGMAITYESADKNVVRVEGNTLIVVGEGETYITASQAGGKDANDVEWLPISQNNYVIVRDPNSQCNGLALSLGSLTLNNNEREFALTGIPQTLTFTAKHGKKSALWGTAPSYAPLIVEQFVFENNQWDWSVVYNKVTGTDNTASGNITLDESATKIRISTIESGTDYTISNIRVSRPKFMNSDVTKVDQEVETNALWQKTVTISHSNIDVMKISTKKGLLTLSTSSLGDGCEDFGEDQFVVSYTPKQKDAEYLDTIVITDSKAEPTTITIPIRLHTTGWNQEIENFNLPAAALTTDALPALTATATSELAVRYESSDEDIVRIVNGNELEIITSGTVTIKAIQDGNNRYYETYAEKEITISKAVPALVAPVGTDVTYLAALITSSLSDGSATVTLRGVENTPVDGTFAWTNPAQQITDNVGAHSYSVTFTPNDTAYYTSATTTVEINVIAATPEATPSAANIVYGHKVKESVLSNEGTEGKWAWNTGNNEAVLAAGTYNDLAVHFKPTSGNYTELDTTVSLTVEKAAASLSWTTAPTELAFNATGVTYEASSVSNGVISYSIVSGNDYAEINAEGVLTILVPGQTVTVQAAQAEGTNYLAPEAITINVTIGAAPSTNTFTNAKGDGNWDDPANWQSGIVPTSNPDIIVAGQLVIDEVKTVGSMTIMPTGGVTIIEGGLLTVNKATPDQTGGYGDLRVAENGALKLNNVLQVRDFTLDAKLAGKNNSNVKEAAASGQVENQNQMIINGDAYFQMTFDPKGKISFGWYDFVVPFPVNVLDGIFRAGDLSNHLVSGVDFLIREYSESRCSNKQNAWTNFSGTMQPGRVYTVTFNYDPNFDQNVFVFKNASSVIGAPETFATQYSEGSGDTDDYGWNGLGNGMLQHGYITGTFAHMQVYNHAENKYDLLNGNNPTFAIGTSFFVQVDHTTPTMTWIAAAANEDHPLYAPKRDNFEVEEFMLSLRNEDQVDASDHFFISASEEATDAYVIGRDLRKMGTPTAAKAAQMWATKGGKTLCDIETRMENDQASSDLNFFAPEAQTYTLSVEESPEDATLYLTYNDRIIWSLSASPYTIDLAKGMTEGYGLRIVARHHSPSVATGMDELNVDQDGNRKVLIDNMLYIITPEGAMYSVTGEKVK